MCEKKFRWNFRMKSWKFAGEITGQICWMNFDELKDLSKEFLDLFPDKQSDELQKKIKKIPEETCRCRSSTNFRTNFWINFKTNSQRNSWMNFLKTANVLLRLPKEFLEYYTKTLPKKSCRNVWTNSLSRRIMKTLLAFLEKLQKDKIRKKLLMSSRKHC